MTTIRIIDVETGVEVSRAQLDADGTVHYSGADVAEAVVTRLIRGKSLTAAQAMLELGRDGWSNGYLMVELPTA